ncbi:MAG TPA: anti-sigma factor [Xanthobacteraceae bacterium]|jgi:anti-sigma-K factor RskA
MDDDDQDVLAAEYVLGTLAANERDQAEALFAIDSEFAQVVRQWERRLGELNVMVEAVEPPPVLWNKIWIEVGGDVVDDQLFLTPIEATAAEPKTDAETQSPSPVTTLAASLLLPEGAPQPLDSAQGIGEWPASFLAQSLIGPTNEPSSPRPIPEVQPGADVVDLAVRLRRWRSMTLLFGTLAVLLTLFIVHEAIVPNSVPAGAKAATAVASLLQAAVPPQRSRLVGVLQHDPVSPAFVVTVDSESRTLTVRRVTTSPDPGRSYELWLLSSHLPAPRSLGTIGDSEFTQRPLPENLDVGTMQAARYAVTLEPAGGSPSGAPSGPILFTGRLVDSVPAPPPRT